MGLRQLVRELCDEAWVIDLGGDNHGANPEENVFAIETPVAVVVLSRNGPSNRDYAGHRALPSSNAERADDKLTAMEAVADVDSEGDPFAGDWLQSPIGWLSSFRPATGEASWGDMPALTDLLPVATAGLHVQSNLADRTSSRASQ